MRLKYKLENAWYFFRYDIPRFVKNIIRFRKALWKNYWWDHHGTFEFLRIGIETMADGIEKNGLEIPESRLKKVAKMRRAVQLIKNYNEDNYIDMAEAELGDLIMHPMEFEESPDHPDCYRMIDKDTPEEKDHNKKVFERAREIEEAEWKELFQILEGQDFSKFKKKVSFDEQFDGSGIRGWWD